MSQAARVGILAGGNWIVDHTKIIDGYPPQDTLANYPVRKAPAMEVDHIMC